MQYGYNYRMQCTLEHYLSLLRLKQSLIDGEMVNSLQQGAINEALKLIELKLDQTWFELTGIRVVF